MSYKSKFTSEQIESILDNVMRKDNTEEYTPTNPYNPATKDYVDKNKGDKTNVLILSYTDDLANGVQGQPVDPEVSAALLDATQTGKACVVKSGQSDILCNLQKTGSLVSIVMELVSNAFGTLLATNTTVTVNTDSNTISSVTSAAVELVDKENILTKDNTTEWTPTGDYSPSTKKYVDDNKGPKILQNQFGGDGISVTSDNGDENFLTKVLTDFQDYDYLYLTVPISYNGNSTKFDVLIKTLNGSAVKTVSIGGATIQVEFLTPESLSELGTASEVRYRRKVVSRVLTQTEYTALGEDVNTNGVLYFVKPDPQS